MEVGRTVRKALKKFAGVIDSSSDRLSHDQIIQACSNSTPSVIGDLCCRLLVWLLSCIVWSWSTNDCNIQHISVPTLGYLFEFYMSFASGYASNKEWRSLCHKLQDGEVVPVILQDKLKADNGTRFIGWLLMHVLNIGNKGKMQMFYITFCAQFFGLSRQGIELMSKYGYGVTTDMFDEIRRLYTARSATISRYASICCRCYDIYEWWTHEQKNFLEILKS